MAKRKKAPRRRERVPNEQFGRLKSVPFRDVVERLLQASPAEYDRGKAEGAKMAKPAKPAK